MDQKPILTIPFDEGVVHGNVYGAASLLKFGRNPDIDTGGYEDIWDGGGTWAGPTDARVHDIASDSANDTSAGTGARTMQVYGLDGDYTLINETVTLNGASNVATTNSYRIIHRMVVRSAGSGGTNAGTLTATAQTDATVTAQINPGNNQTLMAIYQVPAGKNATLVNYYASMNRSTTSGAADVRMLVKPFGEVYQVKSHLGLAGAGSSLIERRFPVPMVILEKSIIKMCADASANNTDISAGFDMLLMTAT